MAKCASCNQEITETLTHGRQLIAEVSTPSLGGRVGRYVTTFSVHCGCKTWTERRYENLQTGKAGSTVLTHDLGQQLPNRPGVIGCAVGDLGRLAL